MTAINIVRPPDGTALYLVADGAIYNQHDGKLLAIASKVDVLAHLPAVVTGRGSSLATHILAFNIGTRFQTFDDVVDGLHAVFEHIVERFLSSISEPFHLYMVGYSRRRDAFESYVIVPAAAAAAAGKGLAISGRAVEPSKLTDLGDDQLIPMFEPTALCKAFDPLPSSAEEIVGDDDGVRALLELQREIRFEETKHPCVVGGFGQVTTLRRSGIETRIVCRWPDAVGEKVAPAPFDWMTFRARWKSRARTVVPLGRVTARRGRSR